MSPERQVAEFNTKMVRRHAHRIVAQQVELQSSRDAHLPIPKFTEIPRLSDEMVEAMKQDPAA